MARYVCVDPCIPPVTLATSVRIPLGGAATLSGTAGLSLVADCSGCRATSDALVKLEPMLAALDPFLDTLGCIAAVVRFVKEVPGAVATLDASALYDGVTQVIGKCKNVLGLATFPGKIVCDFLKTTNDILKVIRSALTCFEGLLTHALTLNINALLLLGDINAPMRRNGECLARRVQLNLTAVNTRASVLGDLIEALNTVFTLLGIAGLSFEDLKQAVTTFSAALSASVPQAPEEVQTFIQQTLDAASSFKDALTFTLSITEPVEALCL